MTTTTPRRLALGCVAQALAASAAFGAAGCGGSEQRTEGMDMLDEATQEATPETPATAEVRAAEEPTGWWIHVEPHPTMRRALAGLPRFLCTPTVASTGSSCGSMGRRCRTTRSSPSPSATTTPSASSTRGHTSFGH